MVSRHKAYVRNGLKANIGIILINTQEQEMYR